jgi:hypothetical protein
LRTGDSDVTCPADRRFRRTCHSRNPATHRARLLIIPRGEQIASRDRQDHNHESA